MLALVSGCDDFDPNLGVTATQATNITTLNPSSQRAGCPGFNLQVNGSGFSTNDTVQWAASVNAVPTSRTTTYVSANLLTAAINTSDLATAGTAVVSVNTAGQTQGNNLSNFVPFTIGASGSCPNLTFTPNISSLSPTAGPIGTAITITGINFGGTQGNSTVTFNGIQAPVTSWSATSIVVPVPTGATNGNLVVTVNGVASNIVFFVVAPNITAISPTSATTGSLVTISGMDFGGAQGSSAVSFNGATAAISSWSDSTIVAIVPAAATTGPLFVRVSGATSNSVTFTDLSEPIISSLNPTLGVVGGSVTIAGSGFGATQSGSTVAFNGTLATVNSWSATSIVTTVPSGATTGNVVVTVGGSPSAGTAFTVGPVITSTNVPSGLVGASVTLDGTGFGATQGTSTVTFGGATATIVDWRDTIVDVTVPTVGSSTANVNIVITVGGLASPGVPFTFIVAPAITSLSPTAGTVGSSVTIAGSSFGATQWGSSVLFNGVTAAITSWSATSIVATVPQGASTGSVTVLVLGAPSNGVAFTVSPSITSEAPLACGTGNEAELSGPYAYSLQGFVGGGVGSPAARLGSFTADGTGKISVAGDEDMTVAGGSTHRTILVSGSSYSVGPDNRGCLTLAYSGGGSATFRFSVGGLTGVLSNGNFAEVFGRGHIIEFDDDSGSGAGTRGAGILLRQDTTAFTAGAMQGNYAFGMEGQDASGGHAGMAGSFSLSNTTGNISAGYFDYNDAGSLPFGGAGTGGASTGNIAVGSIATGSGRTTATFAAGTAGSTNYSFDWVVYIVDTNQFLVMSTDPLGSNTPITSGRAIVTSGPNSFSLASVSGNYVAVVQGKISGVASANLQLLNVNPSNSAYDGTSWQYNTSNGYSSSTITANYAVDANSGRVTVSAIASPPIIYLNESTVPSANGIAGFFLATDGSAGSGLVRVQTSTNLDDGNYGFGIGSPEDNTVVNRTGVLQSASSIINGTADQSAAAGGLTSAQISNITFTSNADGSVTAPDGIGASSQFLGVPDGPILFFFDADGPASISTAEQ